MQAIAELSASRIDYFILLFLRVSGLIFSSPIFGRRNIPNTVKIGYCASIALLFFVDVAPKATVSYGSLFAFVLLCGAERADRVMVGGRWRVVDGRIEGLDVAALIAAHNQAARQLIAG